MLARLKEYFFTTLGLINIALETAIVLFVVIGMSIVAIIMTVLTFPLAIAAGIYKLIEICYYKIKGVKQINVQS